MHVLDIWYSRIDENALAEAVRMAQAREAAAALAEPSHTCEHLYPKLVDESGGAPHIVEKPPLVFHPADDPGFVARVESTFGLYRRSLTLDRRQLVSRYHFVDAAYKVVGVGSVGTRCSIVLVLAAPGDVLFLQGKEARASVYERYVGKCGFEDHGERVVVGQRLMQAATDLFLGWARAEDGRDYYFRQLRDLKTGADVAHMTDQDLERYAVICGWALARAHAKACEAPAKIAGYLGKTAAFDAALAEFANAYADQNERDHAELVAAVRDGRVVANAEVSR